MKISELQEKLDRFDSSNEIVVKTKVMNGETYMGFCIYDDKSDYAIYYDSFIPICKVFVNFQ